MKYKFETIKILYEYIISCDLYRWLYRPYCYVVQSNITFYTMLRSKLHKFAET